MYKDLIRSKHYLPNSGKIPRKLVLGEFDVRNNFAYGNHS
jgi:hypothetical protein